MEKLQGEDVLLARNLIEIPAEGYLIRRGDQLRLDPVRLNRINRPARDGALAAPFSPYPLFNFGLPE